MAPIASTSISVRLTEPYILLVGGPEHERARARRRRAQRHQQLEQQHRAGSAAAADGIDSLGTGTSDVRGTASPFNSPPPSRPGSRAASPARSRGRLPAVSPSSPDFVPPPGRGRSAARSRSAGGSRTRSLSRQPPLAAGSTAGDQQTPTGASAPLDDLDEPPPAMLRGLLTFTLAKPSRIKDITVRLRGLARTEWPEGIGPRRLDTFEETVLTNITSTFFSASHSTMERRAASVGPGSGDHVFDRRAESRGRTSRRASSMAPQREASRGRIYRTHDEVADDGLTNLIEETTPVRHSTLSRIASSTSVDHMAFDREPPPVLPGEQAPAYEVVDSRPSSPMPMSPRRGDQSPARQLLPEPADLARAIHNASLSPRPEHPSSPTPHRAHLHSPLSRPSAVSPLVNGGSSTLPQLARTSTNTSRASQDSTLSHNEPTADSRDMSGASSTASTTSTDTEGPRDAWSSAPVLNTTSQHRANSSRDQIVEEPTSRSTNSASTFESRAANRNTPQQSTGNSGGRSGSFSGSRRRGSHSSNTTVAPPPPSAMRQASSSSSASVRTGTSKTRFSLAGLSDALRGKSASRARETSTVRSYGTSSRPPIERLRREPSPDRIDLNSRSQSRGRKTALKVLREALTSTKDAVRVDHYDSDEEPDERAMGWKEFRPGTYTYPISIAVPASLPPTINADFGHVTYTLKATVHRAGALTPNLTATTEVVLVSAPSQDDTEENESIVVERFWETQMKYHVALSGKSFAIGGSIPMSIRLSPMAKVKLYRVSAILEQKTNYYATGRKLTRHETPKKYTLLRVENKDPREPLLPVLNENSDAILDHPLREFFINPTSSEDWTPQLLDPLGPWYLESNLQIPDCSTKINFSTAHERANVAVSHVLKIMLRVERGDDEFLDSKGKRKLFDIIVESPLHLLSCRVAQNTLPAYTENSAAASTAGHQASQCEAHQHTSRGLHLHLGALGHSSSRHHASSSRPTTASSIATTAQGADAGPGPSSLAPMAGSSSTMHHSDPPTLTMEQNLLFARLVAGQESPAGEHPPLYKDALHDSTSPPPRSASNSRASSRARTFEDRVQVRELLSDLEATL
ncbi:hypothetical protein OIV83_002234 [Microbotryomycetes sp. JL201]|nr:hypothetical protein OIV83_002234 [Microbotryomycetes sp. JL201]